MDLISVIVPVYNVEKYLRQCLDSILIQTYTSLQVIMVDDGSTDNSGGICEEYTKKDERFIVVHKKNAGLGYARNTGLDIANGQYVIFVDSDDYISVTLIEDLYRELKEHQVDVCISGWKCTVEGYRNVQYEATYYPGEKAKKEMLPRMLGSLPDKKDSIDMSVCGVLYDAELIRTHHIRFLSERKIGSEDLFFNIDYMQYADGAYLSEIVGYFYNVNLSSITRSYQLDRFKKVHFLYQEAIKHLEELNYDNTAMLRTKRMFFRNVTGCISQETNPNLDFTFKQRIEHIKSICKDPTLLEAIHGYPVQKLGFAQRMFLYMIEHKQAIVLYFYFTLARMCAQRRSA